MEAACRKYGVSEREACRVLQQWRGTQRYVPLVRADEDALTRDITAQDRNRIIAELRRDLLRAAVKVRDRTGQPLDRYLLFTNVSFTIEQKQQLEEAIRERSEGITVQVLGAADLAAMLNNLPHLRSAYFSTLRFATWPKSWDSHKSASLAGTVPPYIGRAK